MAAAVTTGLVSEARRNTSLVIGPAGLAIGKAGGAAVDHLAVLGDGHDCADDAAFPSRRRSPCRAPMLWYLLGRYPIIITMTTPEYPLSKVFQE